MFQASLAHPQEMQHKHHLVYCVCVMDSNPGAANGHNTHAVYQVSLVQHMYEVQFCFCRIIII
jgi:hypothetical protein